MRRPYKTGEQIDLFGSRYKYQVVVTNRLGSARRLVLFHQQKCNVENRIKEVKSGFNLHHLPCGDFFANWVYFWCGGRSSKAGRQIILRLRNGWPWFRDFW